MFGKYKVGDKVRLCKAGSIRWFTRVGMTITGVIEKIDFEHFEGDHQRPFLIRFTDNRTGAYARNEIERFK